MFQHSPIPVIPFPMLSLITNTVLFQLYHSPHYSSEPVFAIGAGVGVGFLTLTFLKNTFNSLPLILQKTDYFTCQYL
jgi:hypothetical protein